ncbi:MAG: IS110 family transposase [Verrucomicrobiales bacterium]|nr:IS110 family transposase [Verrucomicrobiales bacterium]
MNKSNELANLPPVTEFGAFVGVDWGDEEHALSLRAANGKVIERFTLQQTPEALAQWLNTLRTRFANQKIAIALEQSRGPLLAGLTQYEHIVVFPVNPKSLARFREALYPSRPKDDLGDADLLLEFLLKHRDHLRPWQPDTVETRQMAILNEQRRGFVDSRTELTNRLLAHLKMIFPQAIDLVGGNLTSPMAADFLKQWPSLSMVKKVSPSNLRKFYYGHNSRSEELIAERLELVKNAVALTTDAALVAAHSLAIQTLASQLAALHPFIEKHDDQIAELFAAHPDAPIFESLPGAGPSLAPRLLVSLGTDRGRFSSAVEVSCLTGIAPVTEQSGKSKWVHIRWSCPKFLRQSWHEFANCSIRFCPWARDLYNEYRKHNISHQEAIRKLAYKWQRIVWRMWQDRQPYDEARYEAALLKKRGPKTSAPTLQSNSLSGEQKN